MEMAYVIVAVIVFALCMVAVAKGSSGCVGTFWALALSVLWPIGLPLIIIYIIRLEMTGKNDGKLY